MKFYEWLEELEQITGSIDKENHLIKMLKHILMLKITLDLHSMIPNTEYKTNLFIMHLTVLI